MLNLQKNADGLYQCKEEFKVIALYTCQPKQNLAKS